MVLAPAVAPGASKRGAWQTPHCSAAKLSATAVHRRHCHESGNNREPQRAHLRAVASLLRNVHVGHAMAMAPGQH